MTFDPSSSRPEFHPSPPRVVGQFFLGVDIGQSVDPTAVAIVERLTTHRVNFARDLRYRPDARPVFHVVWLERLPLGTSYVAQAAMVRGIVDRLENRTDRRPEVYVDSTGVGAAVFELFQRAGLRPVGVTITAGMAAEQVGLGWRVPKSELISLLQARLHSGELVIAADLPEARALARELQDFRMSYSAAGAMTFNARVGAHDDLVLAVAVGLWGAERPPRPQPLYYVLG